MDATQVVMVLQGKRWPLGPVPRDQWGIYLDSVASALTPDLALLRSQERPAARVRRIHDGETIYTLTLEEIPMIQPTRTIRRQRGEYSDDYTLAWIFPQGTAEWEIERVLVAEGVDLRATRCTHSFDCCGSYYSSGLLIDRKGSRVLAKIRWTRNI